MDSLPDPVRFDNEDLCEALLRHLEAGDIGKAKQCAEPLLRDADATQMDPSVVSALERVMAAC